MKNLYIKTYGCQMNAYDSRRMAELLAPLGYRSCETSDNADLVILNTCHIREKAAEKLYSDLGRLRTLQKQADKDGRRVIVAVGGCVAQAEGDEVLRRADNVDFVFGPQSYHKLPEMLEKTLSAKKRSKAVETEFTADEKFDSLTGVFTDEADLSAVGGFVTVQEGCDKFCSFCVVPYTRGAEFSRPVEQIIAEVEALLARGGKEIMLLGQNVNAYHGTTADGKSRNLAWLIRKLAELPKLQRIRYITSHPRDMDDDLINAHGDTEKLMPYLHLPVQSGSDRILKAMNRGHTADEYLRIIDKLRHIRPDIAMTSDFIVGFPEESDEDFIATLKLVREVGYAAAYSFKYSPRPGTPAAEKPQIPEHIKDERLQALQQLLGAQQTAFNTAQVGKILPVLFEKPGRHDGQLVGRSPYLQPVHVKAPKEFIGTLQDCRITEPQAHSLFADMLSAHP